MSCKDCQDILTICPQCRTEKLAMRKKALSAKHLENIVVHGYDKTLKLQEMLRHE